MILLSGVRISTLLEASEDNGDTEEEYESLSDDAAIDDYLTFNKNLN
jgi:hypothetical protein